MEGSSGGLRIEGLEARVWVQREFVWSFMRRTCLVSRRLPGVGADVAMGGLDGCAHMWFDLRSDLAVNVLRGSCCKI